MERVWVLIAFRRPFPTTAWAAVESDPGRGEYSTKLTYCTPRRLAPWAWDLLGASQLVQGWLVWSRCPPTPVLTT